MSIGNSVIKKIESERTSLNVKIANIYIKRQKMINKSDSEISDLQRKIDEINKQIIIYNKQNF